MATDLRPYWKVSVKFNPHDVWVGVYWDGMKVPERVFSVHVCVVPCFPVKIQRSLLNNKYVERRGRYYLKEAA